MADILKKATNLGLFNGILDVFVRLWIGNGVSDADCVTFDQKPVVDHRLNVSVEFTGLLEALLQVDDVQQRATARSERLLTKDAAYQLTIFH